jgi:hypothetical protein
MAEQLKNAIKTASDTGDEYLVLVDKYVDISSVLSTLNCSSYKVVNRKDSEIYDIFFYKENKLLQVRKGIIKGTGLQVAREPSRRQMSFFNFYLVFSLFGR